MNIMTAPTDVIGVLGAPEVPAAPINIGGSFLAAAVVGGICYYAIKKKGKQWPDIALGYVLAVAVGAAIPTINPAISNALNAIITGLFGALSGIGG